MLLRTLEAIEAIEAIEAMEAIEAIFSKSVYLDKNYYMKLLYEIIIIFIS